MSSSRVSSGGWRAPWSALREAEWLGPQRARAYLVILALVNLATLATLAITSSGGIDRNGFLLGTDFISFWTAGRMLHAGANVYNITAHIAAQREFYAIPGEFTAFFYPPSFLPMIWPLGFMPYFPALAAWLGVTGGLWVLALRRWFARVGLNGPGPLLLAAFPPAVITLTHGQTSFLVAALLGGGLLLVRERPWLAGFLLGLATIKPQFGLLVPVVLLVGGHWRTFAMATLSALGLAASTALAFGSYVWMDWLAVTSAASNATDTGAIGFAKMVSLFAGLRLLGAPSAAAFLLQAALTLAVAAAIATAAWRRPWTPALAALTLAGAPLATPFVLDYDLILNAFPLAYLFARGSQHGFLDWERSTIAAVFAVGAFARPLAIGLGVPLVPWLLIGLFLLVWRRVQAEAAQASK
jgi:hypothetical protein